MDIERVRRLKRGFEPFKDKKELSGDALASMMSEIREVVDDYKAEFKENFWEVHDLMHFLVEISGPKDTAMGEQIRQIRLEWEWCIRAVTGDALPAV